MAASWPRILEGLCRRQLSAPLLKDLDLVWDEPSQADLVPAHVVREVIERGLDSIERDLGRK
jgi:hypothetical protein